MHKRPRRNHRAHNHGFEQIQEIQIVSAQVWARRHAGAWGLELSIPQKKLTHWVVLTTQLLFKIKTSKIYRLIPLKSTAKRSVF